MKSSQEIEALIIAFIVDELNAIDREDLDLGANLFSEGILDSVSIMRLIAHIEAKLSLKIPPKDLIPRHFMTIDAMVSYLTNE